MNDMLKEILRNRKATEYNLLQNHVEDNYTVKNVPCREVEGMGIVYSAKTMQKVLKLLGYLRKNELKEVDFNFELDVT